MMIKKITTRIFQQVMGHLRVEVTAMYMPISQNDFHREELPLDEIELPKVLDINKLLSNRQYGIK